MFTAPNASDKNGGDNSSAWLKMHQRNQKMISLLKLELTRHKKDLDLATSRIQDLESKLLITQAERDSYISVLSSVSPALADLTSFYRENHKPKTTFNTPSIDKATEPDSSSIVEVASSSETPSEIGDEEDDVIGLSETKTPKLKSETQRRKNLITPLQPKTKKPKLEVIPESSTRTRPRRKAAPMSLQEPSVKSKLRKGDPISYVYTDSIQKWKDETSRSHGSLVNKENSEENSS
ncbi:hypothetical protein P9112_003453 [Eukaryota sp. TZLM1-RC]